MKMGLIMRVMEMTMTVVSFRGLKIRNLGSGLLVVLDIDFWIEFWCMYASIHLLL